MRAPSLAVCIAFVALSVPALAQGPTEFGFKPYGSFGGGKIDSVNLMNGMLNVHIPLVAYSQRGGLLHLGFYIGYQPGTVLISSCGRGCKSYTLKPGAVGIDPDIGMWYEPDHSLNSAGWIASADGGSHPLAYVTTGQYLTADATAITMAETALSTSCTSPYTSYSRVITDSHGVRYAESDCPSLPGPLMSIEDTNGNQIVANAVKGTSTSGVVSWTDTVGRTISSPPVSTSLEWSNPSPTTTTNYSGCTGPLATAGAYLWSVPAPGGGMATFKICMAMVSVTYDPCANVIDPSYCQSNTPANFSEVQSIVVPNGKAWTFEYSSSYGNLQEIVFPTGGTVAYTTQEDGYFTCGAGGTSSYGVVGAVLSRSLDANDGTGARTWTYSYSVTGTYTTTTTVTDPLQYQTMHTFTGLQNTCNYYETETQYPLKTVSIAYNADYNNNVGLAAGVYNVVPTSITTSWPDGQVEQVQKNYVFNDVNILGTSGTYATYGDVVEERDYDFGSGSPGSLLRQVDTTYEYQGSSAYQQRNLVRLPAAVSVYNGAGALAAKTTYGYDQYALQPSGVTTQHDSNPPDGSYHGNLTSVSRWLNTTGGYLTSTDTHYDTGTLYQFKDPLDHPTTYQYSSTYAGAYPTTITDALGHSTTKTYDLNTGLLTSVTDPNSQTTTYSYDPMERPTQIVYPDTGQTTVCYTDEGGSTCSAGSPPYKMVVTKTIDSSQNAVTTNVFDGLGRASQAQFQTGDSNCLTIYTDITYDALGRKASLSNPYCNTSDPTYGVTGYQYDALNRITQVTLPDGSKSTTTYAGNCATLTDEASKKRESCVDALGRLTEVIEDPGGLGYVATYGYDALGNLTSVVQDSSRQRSFVYDSLSRLTSADNPETGTVTYGYDAGGNLTSKTDARAISASYSYNAINQLTGETFSNGDSGISFSYGASNCIGAPTCYNLERRTGMTDAAGSESWSYDAMGRVLEDQRTTNSVTRTTGYRYNPDGSVASLTYPTGRTITYAYDTAERATSAIDSASSINYAQNASYAPQGALASVVLGENSSFGGITSTISYNDRLQPSEIKASSSAGTALDLSYNFALGSADNGNVMAVTNDLNNARSQAFTYDALNRLATAKTSGTSGSNCFGFQYTYDAWGNLTQASDLPGYSSCSNTTGYAFDPPSINAQNQIVESGFSYDASGNLLGDTMNTYAWNAQGELKTGAGVNYLYDGLGDRVEKSNGTIYWYGLGSEVLDETDLSGNLKDEYIYFGSRRIAMQDSSGTISYYAEDFLGSSRGMTTSSGALCYDADFLPYGQEVDYTDTCGSHYKFEGKERDLETNNDDFGARYYRSVLYRWISPDWSSIPAPVPYAKLDNPQTLNLYTMVTGNPESFPDPDGHYVCAKDMTQAQCNDFRAGLEAAQRAADALKQRYGAKSKQYTEAQRAIDAYGKFNVNNGVTIHNGKTGKYGALTKVQHSIGAKTKDNPTGQIINVTMNSRYIGSAMLEAHEGSHVADASAWVASGFSPTMDPTHGQTELRAYQVEGGVAQGLGYFYFTVSFGGSPRQYLLELNTLDPMGASSDWLIRRILRGGYTHLNDPAF